MRKEKSSFREILINYILLYADRLSANNNTGGAKAMSEC